ncbi:MULTISPECIES: glycerol-3-phosphate dehydrogenase/oxidase [Sorangium]|uniref:FAD-dependent oxidoreductase n=1 Tax=Sorangium cellulosum TaxID=56 RepID=A0A4P2QJ14_SORCE|nr:MULTISPECIES: FAD-dependent oxidoreductase [Sorangium]AUX29666.1 FAD-dependent oxidoreductase [Sorangium cellulosum]WCQ89055.1 D-erythritol 1-phosphate dehydrogenase [Sorangium sp. Soce836]
MLRATNIDSLSRGTFDVLVLGAGINGAVAAAALAAKGAKVALIDRGDFAGFTSQESSNLAWGGIKYMESFEFPLVRKLCKSRNLLLRSYPSTVQEIRFYTAHERGFRHGLFKLFLGAWLYWIIGSFFTKIPRLLSRRVMAREEPIINLDGCDGGFEYSDAYLVDNDARFVWGFVRAALDHGARAANYVESLGARREGDAWLTRARDVVTGRELAIRSRVLVNACGPFVDAHNALTGQRTSHRHIFSKGIHLIVDRLTPSRRVLTFFADDGRLFFVIPMGPRTCIGTTDTRVESPHAVVTPEDRRFVLSNINKRLDLPRPLTEADVIAERCGVRPLAVANGGGDEDWLQLSRKHAIEVDRAQAHVSIFGGKLTDCINVGEEICAAVEELGVALPRPAQRWYGEPAEEVRREFFERARLLELDALTPPRAAEKLSARLWRRYGAAARELLEEIRRDPTMAEAPIEGAEDVRCEIAHAARHEMIVKLEDFLRRRTKISLLIRPGELASSPGLREACRILFGDDADRRLSEYIQEQHGARERAEGEAPLAAQPVR